jgi:autotransporter-associated beta strand protein
VAKTGAGTQVLGGNNSYTGATNISGGNLVITGSISRSTANVTGGILSGTGTVGVVNVSSNGTIQPGGVDGSGAVTGGTLTATGNFTLSPGGTFSLAIVGGSGSSDAFGQLSVAGTASIAGAFADAPLSLGNSDVGDVFLAIVDANSAVTGTFSNDPGNNIITLPNGDVYQVFYDVASDTPTLQSSGNDIAVELLVPEPGSLGTLLSGLGVFAGLSRYRGRREG